jgi:hypothetical protein
VGIAARARGLRGGEQVDDVGCVCSFRQPENYPPSQLMADGGLAHAAVPQNSPHVNLERCENPCILRCTVATLWPRHWAATRTIGFKLLACVVFTLQLRGTVRTGTRAGVYICIPDCARCCQGASAVAVTS